MGSIFMGGLAQGRYEETRDGQAQAQQEPHPSAALAPLDEVPPPAANDGAHNDYYAAEDLKTQRDMARWALIQLMVSAGGLYLLIRTLRYTSDATKAAADAARSAQRSAELTEKEMFELRRPNVVANIIEFDLWGENATVYFRLANIGELPADIIRCTVELIVFHPLGTIQYPTNYGYDGENLLSPLRGGAVLASGEKTDPVKYVREQRLGLHHRMEFENRDIDIYFGGKFTYTDPSGVERDAGFCFQIEPPDYRLHDVPEPYPVRKRFGTFDRKTPSEQPAS